MGVAVITKLVAVDDIKGPAVRDRITCGPIKLCTLLLTFACCMLSPSACLLVCLSACLPACLPVCLSACRSASARLSFCPTPSSSLSVALSLLLSLSASLFLCALLAPSTRPLRRRTRRYSVPLHPERRVAATRLICGATRCAPPYLLACVRGGATSRPTQASTSVAARRGSQLTTKRAFLDFA